MSKPDICVIGLGYIGLPTASIFATQGFDVLGVDINPRVVETVNGGEIHIEEPGLRTMVKAGVNSGQLRASTELESANTYIIAVPTPCVVHSEDHRSSDLRAVEGAVEAMLQVIEPGSLVILESTSPPGTTQQYIGERLEAEGFRIGDDVFVAHCPERVLPGHIMRELTQNDRVIGGITSECARRAEGLYSSFVEGDIHLTDATTAELVKLMENTYRDVNIALANELANVCDHLRVDVNEVVDLANCHPRVNLHRAGPGVGGHCLPLDPWFVIESAAEQTPLIRRARLLNQQVPQRLVANVLSALEGVDSPSISIFGVAYKGDVDDARESPARDFIRLLGDAGVEVRVYDPHVRNFDIELSGLEPAVTQSDAIVILASHSEFRYIDPAELGKVMQSPRVFDYCNILDADKWRAAGFDFVGRGRYSLQPTET
jgi:UDP-N-acetyl-D-mannosaminuronic acid dehydrogenase